MASFRTAWTVAALVALHAGAVVGQSKPLVEENIDWAAFLARHDLVWKRLPASWREAAFLGNGRLAMSMWKEPGANALRFGVDNDDVYDRRDGSWGWCAYSRARYHVGDFQLHPVGKITGIDMRQDLYNAELRGTLYTEEGQITFRAFVHSSAAVIIVELQTTEGEHACQWLWQPYEAITTRGAVRNQAEAKQYKENYGNPVKVWAPNPPHALRKEGDVNLCIQRLLVGGGYATAWRDVTHSPGRRTLFISIAMSHPELTSPRETADAVVQAAEIGVDKLVASHRRWWNAYYRASFISLPDTKVESFYWIQIYKYASAARADTGVIDTHGPWLQPTGWPYTTMNMNTQISYWALQPANRLPIADSLFRNLDRRRENLIRNVRPEEYQADSAAIGLAVQQDLIEPIDADKRYARAFCHLPWLCHNYWRQYRYCMDDGRLRGALFPLLRRAINFYLHHLEEGDDGKLHLQKTYSPEYNYVNQGVTRDCTMDLALLRWGCQALIDSCERLKIDDPLIPRWKDVLSRLTDFPTDENGYMVGRDIPLGHVHRHLGHLIMIHPLYVVSWDQVDQRPLIEKSVRHGTRNALGGDYCNFTAAWASSIYASMGDSEMAYHQFMLSFATMFPNTMFAFSGQNIETPLVTAAAMHDMLIQSWGDKIRVFPATPDAWPDVVFHNLRTEGAFLVSAVRSGGKTQWVRIKSLAGEPCRLKTDMPEPLKIMAGPPVAIEPRGDGVFDVHLKKGQEIILSWGDTQPDLSIVPLPVQKGRTNRYGLPAAPVK